MSLSQFDDRPDAIRFRFAADKALAILHSVALRYPGIGIKAVLVACYLAEKEHLNRFGRPIFGASYRAMTSGPMPVEIYQMLKGEPYWLAETGLERFPWEIKGTDLFPLASEPPRVDCLSKSDSDAMAAALDKAMVLRLDRRTAETHGADWQAARLGWVSYEDMLDDTPDKADCIEHIRDIALHGIL